MTPQFEAACVAAATIMAADQGWSDPAAAAIAAFHSFRQSGCVLVEGMDGDLVASAEDAQNFADWWESTLCEEQREAVCTGEDVTKLGDEDDTMLNYRTGELVTVSNGNHAILNALFANLE